jgi:hypothetical protein
MSHPKNTGSSADSQADSSSPVIASLKPKGDHRNRLSRTGGERLVLYFTSSFTIFSIAGYHRIRRLAGYRFLAENSHRLPTSDRGWFEYHRVKSYRTTWEGIKGGARHGITGATCALVYGFVEEAWDQDVRKGKIDAGGSMVAGTASALAYAVFKDMGVRTTWKCIRVGMGLGFVSGILQDLLRWGYGFPPWYMEIVRRESMSHKKLENRKL